MSSQSKMNTTNDEIDLIELVKTLWDKKIWILISTFVFTLLSGIYAFTAKEQWTSKANVIAPRITELGNLLPFRSEYARIVGDGEFSLEKLAEEVHGYFIHFLQSDDLKRQFLLQSETIQNSLSSLTNKEKNVYISEFISKLLIVEKPDNNKKEPTELDRIGLIISFSSEKPELAQKVLDEYIEFINQHALKELYREFKEKFQLRRDNLNFSKRQISLKLNEAKAVKIENLAIALDIAKKADIKKFSKDNSSKGSVPEYMSGDVKLNISDSKLSDGIYLFMLGEQYLQAQLDIAKVSDVVYPLEYYNVSREIEQLNSLMEKEATSLENSSAYRYLSSPELPVKRDWPKRFLLLVIGAFIGCVIGFVIVLARKFIK